VDLIYGDPDLAQTAAVALLGGRWRDLPPAVIAHLSAWIDETLGLEVDDA
jgi:hypothetical protein